MYTQRCSLTGLKVGVIGAGNIGTALIRRIRDLDGTIPWIAENDGIYNLDAAGFNKIGGPEAFNDFLPTANLVFLAIPTLEGGKVAHDYLQHCIRCNIPVITCEKGAFSQFFPELEPHLDRIGFSAVVGGGTMLLRCLRQRLPLQEPRIFAVLNGTLNYLLDQVAHGESIDEAVRGAQRLGYAEPGADNPLDVVNAEATGDVPKKAAILFNCANLTLTRVRAGEIQASPIDEPTLRRLVHTAGYRRYIVSITPEGDNDNDVIGGFQHIVDGWCIRGGFRAIIGNPTLERLRLPGVNNGLLICEGPLGRYGEYSLQGPGAGPDATAEAMLKDAMRLCPITTPKP